MPDKITYRGVRNVEGDVYRCFVHREDNVSSVDYELDPRNDIYDHSPTGIAWGYGGSGPAQLALGILADYFSPDGKRVRYTRRNEWDMDGRDDPNQKALKHYQEFKWAIVALFPMDGEWELPGEIIEKFVTGTLTDEERREFLKGQVNA